LTETSNVLPGVSVVGALEERYEEVLNSEALGLVAELERRFRTERRELLRRRAERQEEIDKGALPGFLAETKDVRDADWRVAPPAPGLVERKVEITGPTERKMTINALNSGASVWLADFEDANVPTWANMVGGQLNLLDAVRRQISYTSPEGKLYSLGPLNPTIVVRPRGWHLDERHLLVDGEACSASLVDFALFLATAGRELLRHGRGPYYYLPKLEGHLEARLWEEVFSFAEQWLCLPRGTVRATVLIETITAAFEMDEILFELADHASGLNAGRWDYLFSIIKKFRNRGAGFVLPDRNSITMDVGFMRAYAELLVSTCHRRGAHAIGGMAAFIPSRRDPELNAAAMDKVRQDKRREAAQGFDGSWVAHPDLVGLCREEFDAVLGEAPNQLSRNAGASSVSAAELLGFTSAGSRCTEGGLRNDISVALQYLASWLRGNGAVAIFNLMEDAATAEIARSQVWQWLRGGVVLDDGQRVTPELVGRLVDEEVAKLTGGLPVAGDDSKYLAEARELFTQVATGEHFYEFLTLPALDRLT
jgi:malate synthase